MEADRRSDWFIRLLVVTLLVQCLLSAVRPMVSFRALALGAGSLELGALGAAFGLVSLLLAVPVGGWTDRWGTFPVLVLGVALNMVSSAALLWIRSIPGLIASQAVLGVGQLCVAVASQTLIAKGRSRLSYDTRFGLFTVTVSIAQFAAPLAAGVLAGSGLAERLPGRADAYGTSAVFVASTTVGILALGVMLSMGARRTQRSRRSAAQRSRRAPIRQVLSIDGMPQAVVASAFVFTTVDVITVYLPAYGVEAGLSVETVALLLSVRAGGSIVGRALLIPLATRSDRRYLLGGSALLSAACLLAFPFVDVLGVLVALVGIAGAGLGVGQPMTMVWAVRQTPPSVRGAAVGLRIAAMRLGQSAIPPLIGAAAAVSSMVIIFLAMAAMLAGVAAAATSMPLDQEDRQEAT
jgi:MFS family permease